MENGKGEMRFDLGLWNWKEKTVLVAPWKGTAKTCLPLTSLLSILPVCLRHCPCLPIRMEAPSGLEHSTHMCWPNTIQENMIPDIQVYRFKLFGQLKCQKKKKIPAIHCIEIVIMFTQIDNFLEYKFPWKKVIYLWHICCI